MPPFGLCGSSADRWAQSKSYQKGGRDESEEADRHHFSRRLDLAT